MYLVLDDANCVIIVVGIQTIFVAAKYFECYRVGFLMLMLCEALF